MDIMGPKLTAAREAAGLSMNALAKLSKVSRAYISGLEKDKANNPSDGKIQALAKALKIKVKDLALDEPAEGEVLVEERGGFPGGARYRTRIVGGRKRTVRI
jgi:transcriptional regulator with XRE-family HTH domain